MYKWNRNSAVRENKHVHAHNIEQNEEKNVAQSHERPRVGEKRQRSGSIAMDGKEAAMKFSGRRRVGVCDAHDLLPYPPVLLHPAIDPVLDVVWL